MENYKVECIAPTGLSYLAYPFEVFFDKEEAMFDFMDIVPDSYSTKHYQRNNRSSKWTLIGEMAGWRKDCCNE